MSGDHAFLSPSGAHRWLNCTAAPAFEANYADDVSKFAAEGTAAHELASHVLENGGAAVDRIGNLLETDGYEFTVDAEMANYVQEFVDYVTALRGDHDSRLVETKVSYGAWVEGGYGLVDFAIVDRNKCTVVDFKYGRGVEVSAEYNPQLKLYALGVLSSLEWAFPDIKKFKLVIHQPRLNNISEFSISKKVLLLWANHTVKPTAEAIYAEKTTFRPGDWCRFCRARDVCDARAGLLQDKALNDFVALEDSDELPTDADFTEKELTPERIGHFLNIAPNIEKFFSSVRTRAYEFLINGTKIPGWKLIVGKSTRRWSDEGEVGKAMRRAKIKADDMYTKKLISPPQAEKILGKSHRIMKEYVTKPPGAPTLAKEDDKRREYVIDAESEFDKLKEDTDD